MTFSINTNTASMAALASLNTTATALAATENQISTGKKISTASDDPAIYSISQGMSSQISGLSGISSGLQFTAQVISTASTQATSTSNLLSTLSSSISEGQTTGLDATTLNNSITAILSQIDANANSANFQGVNLLSGAIGNGVTSTSVSSVQDLNGDKFTLAGVNATSAGLGLSGLNVSQAGLTIAIGSTNPTLSDVDAASGGATALTLTTGPTSTSGTVATAQNPATSYQFILNADPTAVASTTNSTGDVATSLTNALNSVTSGSVDAIAISSTGALSSGSGGTGTLSVATTDSSGNSVYTMSDTGDTITVSKDSSGNDTYSVSTARDGNGNTTAQTNIVSVNTTAADLTANKSVQGEMQVNSLMSAMQSAGFGVTKDSATGDLTVSGNNVATDTTSVSNSTMTNTGAIGTSVTATETSGSAIALATVNAAISKMSTISSTLGSSTNLLTGLQSSVTTLSAALTSGVGALTDADLSAESAKLTSLQTKQSLAIQALSIANSQSQSILSLFR